LPEITTDTAFQVYKDVAVDWEWSIDAKLLHLCNSKRKEKKGADRWFIGWYYR
jgi:hypothetical protein